MATSVANPYAAPATGRPDRTRWSLWTMESRVTIGPHPIDVRTWHWTGLTTVCVGGKEVHRERNMGWHARIDLIVGDQRVQILTRWYPLQPVQVLVNDTLWIDDLFPQLGWLKAMGAAVVFPLIVAFSASITYDIWRMIQLARSVPLD